MCTYLIRVAEGYNDRAIFRCEHGTFHLAWDRALFHLSADELNYIHALFSRKRISRNAHAEHQEIQLLHQTAPNGQIYFELWIEESGLKLSFEDCEVLRGLIRDALKWQKNQPALTRQEHIRMAKALTEMDLQPYVNTKTHWN